RGRCFGSGCGSCFSDLDGYRTTGTARARASAITSGLTRRAGTTTPLRVTPDEAIAEAAAGKLRPVYLVLGEERVLVDRAVHALREATQKGGIAGFNEDKFTAGEASIGAVLGACRMLPMMAPRRFVMVRGLDRWEKKEGEDEAPARASAAGKKGRPEASPLDELAEYTKEPPASTVLCLVSPKLHGQRKLVTAAKKGGFLVSCQPLSRDELPRWITRAARD